VLRNCQTPSADASDVWRSACGEILIPIASQRQFNLTLWRPCLRRADVYAFTGDRGKGDGIESTDGIVGYWSSHLDGAESELIVPTGHEAHLHPDTIADLRRILLLNLRNVESASAFRADAERNFQMAKAKWSVCQEEAQGQRP
jgi:hypothetical protein